MAAVRRRREVNPLHPSATAAAPAVAIGPSHAARRAAPATGAAGQLRQRLRAERNALLLTVALFTALWLLALASGVVNHTGVRPANKGELPLAWFDLLVRNLGPLLPLPVLLLRWYASVVPARARELGVLYCVLSGVRALLYTVHCSVHWAVAVEVGRHPHLISDHIFLGSSLLAIFSAEGHMLLKDMRDPGWPQRQGAARSLIVAAWGLCVYLTALLCLEMRVTAIHYHRPRETILAALAGLIIFQAPTALWLLLTPEATAPVASPVEQVDGVRGIQMQALDGQVE